MLDLYLMTFSKRENSTLIPTASQLASATVVSVALKGGCDILNPTFILESSQIPAGKNYAKFQDRYYFITGISSVRNNLVEITARVDVLGSWKSAIQSMSAFVAYDTTSNSELSDKRLSVKRSKTIARDAVNISGYSNAGTIVVSLQGEGNIGAFILPGGNAYKLTEGVYTKVQQDLAPLTQMLEFYKYLITQLASQGQAGDNIKSAYWYPWVISDNTDQLIYPLKLGSYETQYGGDKINKYTHWIETVVEIPWQASDWRRNSPYTEIYLYMPFIGVINVPTSQVMDEEYLTVQYGVNRLNGNISACVIVGNNNVIYTGSGSSGMPLPIGASNINTGAVAGGLISGAVSLASYYAGASKAAAIAGLGAIAGAGIESLLPLSSSTLGGGGGASNELYSLVTCWTVFHDTIQEPSAVSPIMGTPAMVTKSLSGLSGYVQTVGASVQGDMLDVERNQINTYLDRGIYID